MFKSPGDIAFSIFSIDIHFYGIIMALSILAGLIAVLFIGKKYFKDISQDSIIDSSLVIIISGIFFARLYYVLLDFNYFIKHPSEIICIWNGGISIQGAIIGAIIGFWFYAEKNHLDYLKYADLFSFGGIIGQVIGRWGNFFNSEAFGLPTDLPWKLYIPYSMRPFGYKTCEYFHPAFLYESILNFIIFCILFYILVTIKPKKSGIIFLSYFILYSIARLIVETIRLDSVLNVSNFHAAHIASFVFILFAVLLLVIILKKKDFDKNSD